MTDLDILWVLVAAALVFFMQAGFAMVETGFTRAKNAGNIIMKNMMDFSLGTLIYWFIGFAIMYGAGGGFAGSFTPFSGTSDSVSLIFQTVFCATAATIVSGAMAERTKFSSYLMYTVVISAIVYPISGHWIWGGGWLAQEGFIDFAGSTAVHLVGGTAAFVGAMILGPRIGKYGPDGKSKAIPGHSITLGALGVFILWFGWFGFNGGSQLGIEGAGTTVANIFVTTNIAAASAATVTMIVSWIRYKKPDVSMTLNGALAGLVGITAGCAVVDNYGALAIGAISGFVVLFAIELIDKVIKVDDPVGAVSVHGVCGGIGTILVGFFAVEGGVLYGDGFSLLGIQTLGVVSVMAWVVLTMGAAFLLIKYTFGLRVTREEEIEGLDTSEHGLINAYAGFAISADILEVSGGVPIDASIPVQVMSKKIATDSSFSKIEIICRQSKFEALKSAMNMIGITGMTVTNVQGCGVQKGSTEYYRGVKVDINLLPKVQVEIVVCKVPVAKVIETAKKILYTGHIGDGKIFVYNVENVIKIRTGEEGCAALQDIE